MEDWEDHIEIDEENLGGKPVIKGTGVAVHAVVGDLADGESLDEIRTKYGIGDADIQAALAWTTDTVWEELVHLRPRDRINIDPAVVGGKPVIRGTRLPVQVLLGALAGGSTIEEVMSDWVISREDVLAAFRCGADSVAFEIVHALPGR